MGLLIIGVAVLTLVVVETYFMAVRRRPTHPGPNGTTRPPEPAAIQ